MILLKEALSGKKIIIYGAGKIGKQVLKSLEFSGYKIEFFWDKNAELIKGLTVPVVLPRFNGIPVESRKEYLVFVTLFAKSVNTKVSEELFGLGYDVISISKDTLDEIGKYISKGEGLVIPKIGLLVTNKCNLSCRGCNHLQDLYPRGEIVESTPSELLSDLGRIIDAVDSITQLVIVGGEAFLHPGLYEIIERVLELPKIGTVQIITNGTIRPMNSRLFKLLANPRVIVEVSGYKVPMHLQNNVHNLLSGLCAYHVNHTYLNTLQWFDFGDFTRRPYTPQQHYDIYSSCCFVSNDLFNGKLHKCSRSVFAGHLGKIPDYPEDYLNIRTSGNLKSELIDFLDKCPQVCFHCNGTSTSVIEAGCQ